jgi:hypothetical protein
MANDELVILYYIVLRTFNFNATSEGIRRLGLRFETANQYLLSIGRIATAVEQRAPSIAPSNSHAPHQTRLRGA